MSLDVSGPVPLVQASPAEHLYELFGILRGSEVAVIFRNFFYRLCALRVAKLFSNGSGWSTISAANYRNFVRRYAREFGEPALGEESDAVLLGPAVLLWEEKCLDLWKFDQGCAWWHFTEIGQDFNLLIGGLGLTIQLTAKGEELLSEMEAKLVPPPTPPTKAGIGFHA